MVDGAGWRRPANAARPGQIRASDADREQAVDLLKSAFVQGRLAKDEFTKRVGGALTSRTHAELAALTFGIPAAALVPAPSEPALPKHRRQVSRRARAGAWLAVSTAIMLIDAVRTGKGASDSANQLYTLCILMFVISFVTFWCVHFTEKAKAQAGGKPGTPASGAVARRRP